ncbi:hypothetical protein [Pseudomonas benzenivorans]|nr:hypothetical protein [Pseudomonas benzenivorans]
MDLKEKTQKISPGKNQNYTNPNHLEIGRGSALRDGPKEGLA